MLCEPTQHNFKLGGDANGDATWEAWIFCGNCGALGMVPTDADAGLRITEAGTEAK